MSRYDLTDFEWRVIEPLLSNKSRGVPLVDDPACASNRVGARHGEWMGLCRAMALSLDH
jgi:transposase